MDENRAAEALQNIYLSYRDSGLYNGGQEIIRALEQILDSEFQSAIPSLGNIDITTPAGTLYFGEVTFNTVFDLARIIGDEVARYWSETIELTGEPESCDEIESIENTALDIAVPITNDLLNQAKTITITEPYFYRLFEIIFGHVREIIWTVEESDDAGCSETFEVTVK